MKISQLSLFSLACSLVASSPCPVVEWVTIIEYVTVHGTSTAALTETATTTYPETTATQGAETEAASEVELHTTAAPANAVTLSSTATAAETTAASATSSQAASSSALFSGDGTYYSTGLGACGITNTDTDYICAISHELYDEYTPGSNPNDNTLCGKKIKAFYGGKSVEVTVVDRCEGCSYYDLDFSPSAFEQLADELLGRIKITWEWV